MPLNILLCVAALLAIVAGNHLRLHKMDMSLSIGSKCLDGSPLSFYMRRNSSNNFWILFFEGGGWCFNETECYERSLTSLGSSNEYAPSMKGEGLMSPNQTENPYFYDWNAVFIKSCDGASLTGDSPLPLKINNTLIYFRGYIGLGAIIFGLEDIGISTARRIVVSGCDSGGLAAIIHGDFIASSFPRAKVKVFPMSGFYPNISNIDGDYAFSHRIKKAFDMQNSRKGLNQKCIENFPNNELHCIFPENMLPFSTTPIMPINSFFDTWQLACILAGDRDGCYAFPDWNDCIRNPQNCSVEQLITLNEWQETFMSKFNSTLASKSNGLFLDSCFDHCTTTPNNRGWNHIFVNNTDVNTAVSNWYYNEEQQSNVFIDCDLTEAANCNPTCP